MTDTIVADGIAIPPPGSPFTRTRSRDAARMSRNAVCGNGPSTRPRTGSSLPSGVTFTADVTCMNDPRPPPDNRRTM